MIYGNFKVKIKGGKALKWAQRHIFLFIGYDFGKLVPADPGSRQLH